MAAEVEEDSIILLSKGTCGIGNGSIRNSELHILSEGFPAKVGRHVAVFDAEFVPDSHSVQGALEGLVGGLAVESPESLHNGICNGDDACLTGHAVGFVGHQVPDGQEALLLANLEHGLHHIVHPLRLDDAEKRHFGAVGVPEREGGVVVEVCLFVDLIVRTTVGAIHVVEKRWGYHAVVKGGVENGFGRLPCLYLYLGKCLVPGRAGIGADLVEFPAADFPAEVHLGAVGADSGNTHLDEHLFTFGGAETRPREQSLLLLTIIVRRLDEFHFHGLGELGIEVDALVLRPSL